MKKICICMIICTILFLMTGCAMDPGTYYFSSDELLEEVVKIELVECKNDNPKMIIVNDNSIPRFDINSVKLVKELPSDKIEPFICELSTVTFHMENESVDSPTGYAVLIYNKNDEIIVISCTPINGRGYSMVAKFSVDGKFINHIARFADRPRYEEIVGKYFNIYSLLI